MHFKSFHAAPIFILLVPTIGVAGDNEPIILKHEGWVAAVAFAPDGKTLASAGADKVVRLWEVGTWKGSVLKGHTDCVCAIAFDKTGKWLATGSFDRTAKVWNLDEKFRLEGTLPTHPGAVLEPGFENHAVMACMNQNGMGLEACDIRRIFLPAVGFCLRDAACACGIFHDRVARGQESRAIHCDLALRHNLHRPRPLGRLRRSSRDAVV